MTRPKTLWLAGLALVALGLAFSTACAADSTRAAGQHEASGACGDAASEPAAPADCCLGHDAQGKADERSPSVASAGGALPARPAGLVASRIRPDREPCAATARQVTAERRLFVRDCALLL